MSEDTEDAEDDGHYTVTDAIDKLRETLSFALFFIFLQLILLTSCVAAGGH